MLYTEYIIPDILESSMGVNYSPVLDISSILSILLG